MPVHSLTEGLKRVDDLERIFLFFFASGEGHVQDGRKQTWQKDDTSDGPMVPTPGPCPYSRAKRMVARVLNVRLGCVRIATGEEAASIKELLSLPQRPTMVDILQTSSLRNTTVIRRRTPRRGHRGHRKTYHTYNKGEVDRV